MKVFALVIAILYFVVAGVEAVLIFIAFMVSLITYAYSAHQEAAPSGSDAKCYRGNQTLASLYVSLAHSDLPSLSAPMSSPSPGTSPSR
jgi:hypothetical protein